MKLSPSVCIEKINKCENFKLINCTFIQGTANFNDPKLADPELSRLAKIAIRMGANLELSGHTDPVGTEEENILLSKNRAQAVKDFLVNSCGFPEDRVTAKGYGAAFPNCPNDTDEGRACNRRVEVKFWMPELDGQQKAGPKKKKEAKIFKTR